MNYFTVFDLQVQCEEVDWGIDPAELEALFREINEMEEVQEKTVPLSQGELSDLQALQDSGSPPFPRRRLTTKDGEDQNHPGRARRAARCR